ncbi:DUF1516 family protein [Marinococcus sp. PL1-022]|uniref:DUF1516 family protein n=1 Tax=Marinococcus sp. PL1-022 TaxID=3095363 RepID=UPI0029C4EB2B|nr:DUF1516 family protein [Marinococcus sp. PL1-022]MDX6152605.1 DUF1516 family protein [Marinococcus sp. PL1-022]
MIVWAAILILGFVFYFHLKKGSSNSFKPTNQTLRSLVIAFIIVNLVVMILFNDVPHTPLTYFVLGAGTMAVIGIVVEIMLAYTKKHGKNT